MDILSYLLELLQQRKEVGITGLGTFYKKKYPGRYDKEKQTFLPPGYTLQFSTDLTEEEALADFISAKRNISNDSAKHYITQFAEEVNQKLELDHEAELENTGRLFFTEHEGLSFEPVKNINYGSEFYGLPSLPETAIEDVKPDSTKEDEEVYDEIAEAPIAPSPFENKAYHHPVIENVELDEVKDDLKNTLKHSENPAEEIVEAPEFIREQHEEHPNRFGHTPESEVENIAAEHQAIETPESADAQEETDTIENTPETEVKPIAPEPEEIEVPESVVAQHEEHPDRFGHTPESEAENIASEQDTIETPESADAQEETDTIENTPETEVKPIAPEPEEIEVPESVITPQQERSNRFSLRSETEEPKTYINLQDEVKSEEPVIEAPEFIKEQHAEHPNRFGHDPIVHDEETPQGMSAWLKVTIVILILVIIAAITYLVKPELLTGQTEPVKAASTVIDSPKVAIDTAKAKQDSIAKTDSILKANQVQKKADTVKKEVVKPVVKPAIETPKENKVVPNTGPSTFDVIAASYKTVAGAEKYIAIVKTRGLNAKIANMAGPWKKVSIASFKTQKEAEEQKEILQKKLKGKGFYVQQIFNNTQP
jgi:nucleoid DNA-binding protein